MLHKDGFSIPWPDRDVLLALATLALIALDKFLVYAFFAYDFTWLGLVISSLLLLLLLPLSGILLFFGLFRRSRPRPWRRRAVRAGLLMLLAGGVWLASTVHVGDRATRHRIEAAIDLGELQAWAVQTLDAGPAGSRPLKSWSNEEKGARYEPHVPPALRRLEPAILNRIDREGPPHIRIEWGGGLHHWGVHVGPPGFRPAPGDHARFVRWRDGIYGYQER